MTVSNTTRSVREEGNGSKTAFDFSFKIFEETDLKVYKLVRATDAETLMVLNTDYTVSINTSTEGGTVTFVVAPTTLQDSYIKRQLPRTQEAEIPTESNFPEQTIEDIVDRQAMILIEQDEEIGRAVLASEFSSDPTAPSAEELTALVQDATDAATAAQTAQTAAELAETHAETAEANAETAEANAEAAQAAVEAILDAAWVDHSASANVTGFSGTPEEVVYYKKIGKTVFIEFHFKGTSNANSVTFTLPFAAVARSVTSLGTAVFWKGTGGQSYDNGALVGTLGWEINGSTVTVIATDNGNGFTTSGDKEITGQFFYETA